MNFKLCVVSHRRHETFKENTLRYLSEAGLGFSEVDVFLSDKEDVAAYARSCPVGLNFIETGSKNLREKFNFVHNYYPVGERVFCMEDDVKLVRLEEGWRCAPFVNGFKSWLDSSFAALGGGGLFGVVPHSNHFFMKRGNSESLKLCVANAFGFVSTKDPALEVRFSSKNDYERTLLYWNKYGRVLRSNDVGVITKNYKNPGGLEQELGGERLLAEEEAVSYLCSRFPHLVSRNQKKNSIYPELKLKTIRQGKEVVDWGSLQAVRDEMNGYS